MADLFERFGDWVDGNIDFTVWLFGTAIYAAIGAGIGYWWSAGFPLPF